MSYFSCSIEITVKKKIVDSSKLGILQNKFQIPVYRFYSEKSGNMLLLVYNEAIFCLLG